MQTLYRKYRPQLWKEVFGQNSVKTVLMNQILTNKISHAYIFAGSRGIAKTTVARLFAKTLNCKNRKEGEIEPCNHCESCKAINDGNDLNIIEIDAASYTGVDNVRELRNIAKVPPGEKTYKIFIIDEVHMLSKAAFNALLKILEEPPERVIFILATTEINKVIDTILSRCQIFKFKKATEEEILEDLGFIIEKENITVDKKLLEDIALKSLGGFRDAESLLGQIISSTNETNITSDIAKSLINNTNKDLILEFSLNIIEKNAKNNLELIEKIKELDLSFGDFILDLIEFFRKILIYKYNNDVIGHWSNLEDDQKDKIIETSKKLDFNRLNTIIRKLIDAKLDIEKSDIIELPLELTVIELSQDEEKKREHEHVDLLKITEPKISKKIDAKILDKDIDDILDSNEKDKNKKGEPTDEERVNTENELAKKDRLLKKFGIKKGEESASAEATADKEDNGVSVLDILKEEFKDEIIS